MEEEDTLLSFEWQGNVEVANNTFLASTFKGWNLLEVLFKSFHINLLERYLMFNFYVKCNQR